jgi:hypothetical protein
MKLQFLQKENEINKFKSFLQNEKKNGIKSGWYFYHYDAGQMCCMDTKEEFQEQVECYSQQKIKLVSTIPLSKSLCDRFGVYGGSIITFREMNEKTISPTFDPLAFAFDIMSGTAEFIVIKLHLIKTN